MSGYFSLLHLRESDIFIIIIYHFTQYVIKYYTVMISPTSTYYMNTTHTLFCLRFPTKRVLSVSSAANRTDLMLCRKKGHNLGTSSVRDIVLVAPVPWTETDGHDRIPASNIMMLLVDAVKSSSSTRVSHKVTRTSWTCKLWKLQDTGC